MWSPQCLALAARCSELVDAPKTGRRPPPLPASLQAIAVPSYLPATAGSSSLGSGRARSASVSDADASAAATSRPLTGAGARKPSVLGRMHQEALATLRAIASAAIPGSLTGPHPLLEAAISALLGPDYATAHAPWLRLARDHHSAYLRDTNNSMQAVSDDSQPLTFADVSANARRRFLEAADPGVPLATFGTAVTAAARARPTRLQLAILYYQLGWQHAHERGRAKPNDFAWRAAFPELVEAAATQASAKANK
jgi:hypothetical protein